MNAYPVKTDYEKQQEKQLHQLRAAMLVHYLQQDSINRQNNQDINDTTNMLLGTTRALYYNISEGFLDINQQMDDFNRGVSSIETGITTMGHAVNQVDVSVNRLGMAFMNHFIQVEQSDKERYLQIKAKVDESVSHLSDIALQMYDQSEILLDINQTQKEMFSNLQESIESLHETVKHDHKKWATEKLNTGLEYLGRKLLPEAAEAFKEAIEFYTGETLAHYFLGKIYAFGIDDAVVLVDYPLAIKHLNLAMRYSKDQITTKRDMALLYADAAANLARVYYLNAKLEEVDQ